MVSPLQNKLYLYTKMDFDFELLESSNSFNFAFIILPSFRHYLTNAGQLALCHKVPRFT